ncbi:uncharacterized protein J3D65DRAFT_596575, partial [Phyllosticta citribraziliensis]
MLSVVRACRASLRPRRLPRASPAVSPSPRYSSRYPVTASAYHAASSPSPLRRSQVMFKKAIDSHDKTSKAPTTSQQFFPSKTNASQQARALSSASGNVSKPTIDALKNPNTGVKRTSTGLAKSLSEPPNAFADGSRRSPYIIDSASKENNSSVLGVELYDDDFDDDLDLDVEDPAGKASVQYPSLSAPPEGPKSRPATSFTA